MLRLVRAYRKATVTQITNCYNWGMQKSISEHTTHCYNSRRAHQVPLLSAKNRKRLGYVCNPRSLKEGTETSRRRTDELGYRLERPIHFECKLNEPMHIGMRLLHPAAADHSVSINRQQVQRIFRFSLRSRAGARPLSGGTGAVATGRGDGTWRLRSLLQGTRVTYT